MIDEAHARGLQATIRPFGCRTAVELGIDSIEHGIYACVEEFREASEAGPPGPDNPVLRALTLEMAERIQVWTPAATHVGASRRLSRESLELLHPGHREKY
jgi:imidazolonepropionase-like amidohydrolase